MSDALFSVDFAGPHVTIQDAGRKRLMRYGVPASGPMDRTSFAAANVGVGNPACAPAIEVSRGGLVMDCISGAATFAVTGGGFVVEHGSTLTGSWTVGTVRAGERLAIRPGHWGSWAYLAFAGQIDTKTWLGSASTHALSGFGGGKLSKGHTLTVHTRLGKSYLGPIPCPIIARPRSELRVVLGPQERFFSKQTIETFLSTSFRMSNAYDRMGARLQGTSLVPSVALDMPSEPIIRGSVQIAGDGVPTVLLADHQTTGGYPKIATVLDIDLDGFSQLRPRDPVRFISVTPQQAIERTRLRAETIAGYLASLVRRRSTLS